MSTLIIGVLFVVALVAIIGIVFVLRSERRPAQVDTSATSPQVVPADTSAAALEQEVPTNEALPVLPAQSVPQPSDEQEEPTMQVARQDSADSTAYDGTYTPPVSEVRVRLNGQFYELANSLRDLRQQASDMEQRLNVLTEMIDSIERKQHS